MVIQQNQFSNLIAELFLVNLNQYHLSIPPTNRKHALSYQLMIHESLIFTFFWRSDIVLYYPTTSMTKLELTLFPQNRTVFKSFSIGKHHQSYWLSDCSKSYLQYTLLNSMDFDGEPVLLFLSWATLPHSFRYTELCISTACSYNYILSAVQNCVFSPYTTVYHCAFQYRTVCLSVSFQLYRTVYV